MSSIGGGETIERHKRRHNRGQIIQLPFLLHQQDWDGSSSLVTEADLRTGRLHINVNNKNIEVDSASAASDEGNVWGEDDIDFPPPLTQRWPARRNVRRTTPFDSFDNPSEVESGFASQASVKPHPSSSSSVLCGGPFIGDDGESAWWKTQRTRPSYNSTAQFKWVSPFDKMGTQLTECDAIDTTISCDEKDPSDPLRENIFEGSLFIDLATDEIEFTAFGVPPKEREVPKYRLNTFLGSVKSHCYKEQEPDDRLIAEIMWRGHEAYATLGPTVAAQLVQLEDEEKEKKWKAICPSPWLTLHSSVKGVIPIVRVTAPDVYNYTKELDEVKEKFKHNLDKLREEKEEIALPSHVFKLMVSEGGLTSFLEPEESCSVLVNKRRATIHGREDTPLDPRTCHTGLVKYRDLTEMEVQTVQCLRYGRGSSQKEHGSSNLFNCIYTFCDSNAARSYRDQCKSADIPVMCCPRELLIGFFGQAPTKELSLQFVWLKSPPARKTTVTLADARDANIAIDVFGLYNCTADVEKRAGNRVLTVHNPPPSLVTNVEFKEWVDEILGLNDVKVVSAALEYPFPVQDIKVESNRTATCQFISEQLVKCAIEVDSWSDDMAERPTRADELAQYAFDYKRFPWTFRLDELDADNNRATVIFNDFDQGTKIADSMVGRLARDYFSLNRHDRRGVLVRGRVRMAIRVPAPVRMVKSEDIKKLDNEFRKDNELLHYAYIVDKYDAALSTIEVHGYPDKHVESCLERLKIVLEPVTFDCSSDDRKWLLYGVGAAVVEKLRDYQKEANDGAHVLLEIDQTLSRLMIYGCERATLAFLDNLSLVIEDKWRIHLETEIEISFPRFFNAVRRPLQLLHEKGLVTWLLGADAVQLNAETGSIDFHGDLPRYEALLDLLDELDALGLSTYEHVTESGIASLCPTCAVCMSPVSRHFYVLDMCGHHYCRECINMQVSSHIRDRDFPMSCVRDGCGALFSTADIKRLLLGGTSRLPWLDAEKLHPFARSSLDALLNKQGSKYFSCLTPDCDRIFKRLIPPSASSANMIEPSTSEAYAVSATALAIGSRVVQCESCRRRMCAVCALDEHIGLNCEQNAFYRENADASLKKYLEEKGDSLVRRCPKDGCSAIIEKDAGCNHIQCARCGTHFCWICLHMTSTEGQIYRHLSETHGGADGGWRFDDQDRLIAVPNGEEDAMVLQNILRPGF